MSYSNSNKRRGEPQQGEGSSKRKNVAATNLTVELEPEVLDCPICSEPLEPPIFQCALGHLICSTCYNKIPKLKKCHHCSRKCDYNRCYGIENIIGSIQVPCSNSKYGCAIKTSYSEKEDHKRTCPNAPCFCPEIGCSFVGSTGMLLQHLTTKHHWPRTTVMFGRGFDANIQDGVHILSCGENMFLLKISSELFGSVVSVFSVQHHEEPKFRCAMYFNFGKNNSFHSHFSEFRVPTTTLDNGIPRNCFLYIVPKSYLEKDSKISVTIDKAKPRKF
ncbi:hypothetical protein PR202_ga23644 [Eleusine coracana subsp. coracana]|uniref:RING-type E3 ubiquitin transferase n=1 Tax=Eleusine coracana subsp. coracana TaxID=191504 RepID=A0AAV5D7D2_ELECO|nr:hypothetical protein PR202_ga23644 [Eleusine coracana subsp. coracana]